MKKLLLIIFCFVSFIAVKPFEPLDYGQIAKNYNDFEKMLTQEGITKEKIEKIFFTTLSDDIIGVIVTDKIGTYKLYVKKKKNYKYVSRIEYHETISSRDFFS